MELLVFGSGGVPTLVFPTSMGRFYQYEDMGMIEAIRPQIEQEIRQVFCVDSVDSESWYNRGVAPRDRVLRHIQYDHYVRREVVPFIRERNPRAEFAVTGCSFGGYHSVNFALRYPDLVSHCISMGGAFDIKQFLDGYYDENCYFNNPPDFVPNLHSENYLTPLRQMKIILATGEHDICLGENYRMAEIMGRRGIPHWLDVWGNGTGHDWPWWRQMANKFF
jgi:esterase/lipase superfamily enzyme